MELTFSKGHITRDMKGNFNVILEVPKDQKHNMEPLNELLNDEKVKTCKIEHQKKKRSLKANNYAWTLITQIADVLRSSKDEVYFQMLKRYGQSSIVSVEDRVSEDGERIVDIFKQSVKYCEEFGESELNGKNFIHIKVFMGSSEMDSKQFSILLDGIVSECELLSIPTLEDLEIRRLIEEWGK